MNQTEDRARELLARSHERLQEIIRQAKVEACRIQTLDEVLGEETLRGAFPDPFHDSLSVVAAGAPALPKHQGSSPSKPKKKKPTKKRPRKKPKGKTRGTRLLPTITEMVMDVLQSAPGEWLTVDDIRLHIEQAGYRKVSRSSLQATLIELKHKSTPWLSRKKEGGRVLYSHVQSQLGVRPDQGTQAG